MLIAVGEEARGVLHHVLEQRTLQVAAREDGYGLIYRPGQLVRVEVNCRKERRRPDERETTIIYNLVLRGARALSLSSIT